MLRFCFGCAILAASLAGCVPIHPPAATTDSAGAARSGPPDPPAQAPAARPDVAAAGSGPANAAEEAFESRVLPVLRERCSPCHFEGGRMFDRLPFDRPGTIRVLGTALFTRIRDEEERQAIRDFLGIGGGLPVDPESSESAGPPQSDEPPSPPPPRP